MNDEYCLEVALILGHTIMQPDLVCLVCRQNIWQINASRRRCNDAR
jgi:hypothetical protein